MNDDREQIAEMIRNRIQSYLDPSQSVGLGVGVVAAESDCMVFGGTAGFGSYLAFSKRHRAGVVLLANFDLAPDAIGRALLVELVQQKVQSSNGPVRPPE